MLDTAPHPSPGQRLPAAIDRRASPRLPLRRGAMLEVAGRRRVAVSLLDLSEGGAALLAMGLDLPVGSGAALMVDTALLPATVVAVSAERIHLAFLPLPPRTESALRRLLEHGLAAAIAA